MDKIEVTQADVDAWETYGPAIFNMMITGPQALARHRLATRTDATPDHLAALVERVSAAICETLRTTFDIYAPELSHHLDLKPEYWGDVANAAITAMQGFDVAALVEALVAHNDALRSASQVAYRDGKDTNWLTFRGAITYTLAEHHETVNAARQALAPFTKGQNDEV